MDIHISYPMNGGCKLVIQTKLFLELSMRLNNFRSTGLNLDEPASSTSTSSTTYAHSSIGKELHDLCELFELIATKSLPLDSFFSHSPTNKTNYVLV